MKYEIYQLKEDTMEQVKLRFMASDQAAQLGGIHRENYRLVYEVMWKPERTHSRRLMACSASLTSTGPQASRATA